MLVADAAYVVDSVVLLGTIAVEKVYADASAAELTVGAEGTVTPAGVELVGFVKDFYTGAVVALEGPVAGDGPAAFVGFVPVGVVGSASAKGIGVVLSIIAFVTVGFVAVAGVVAVGLSYFDHARSANLLLFPALLRSRT